MNLEMKDKKPLYVDDASLQALFLNAQYGCPENASWDDTSPELQDLG